MFLVKFNMDQRRTRLMPANACPFSIKVGIFKTISCFSKEQSLNSMHSDDCFVHTPFMVNSIKWHCKRNRHFLLHVSVINFSLASGDAIEYYFLNSRDGTDAHIRENLCLAEAAFLFIPIWKEM